MSPGAQKERRREGKRSWMDEDKKAGIRERQKEIAVEEK